MLPVNVCVVGDREGLQDYLWLMKGEGEAVR